MISNVKGLKELGLPPEAYRAQRDLVERISHHLNSILLDTEAMRQERKKANALSRVRDRAIAYDEQVKPYFDQIRYHLNKLEQIVEDSKWPLPKLRELLFVK